MADPAAARAAAAAAGPSEHRVMSAVRALCTDPATELTEEQSQELEQAMTEAGRMRGAAAASSWDVLAFPNMYERLRASVSSPYPRRALTALRFCAFWSGRNPSLAWQLVNNRLPEAVAACIPQWRGSADQLRAAGSLLCVALRHGPQPPPAALLAAARRAVDALQAAAMPPTGEGEEEEETAAGGAWYAALEPLGELCKAWPEAGRRVAGNSALLARAIAVFGEGQQPPQSSGSGDEQQTPAGADSSRVRFWALALVCILAQSNDAATREAVLKAPGLAPALLAFLQTDAPPFDLTLAAVGLARLTDQSAAGRRVSSETVELISSSNDSVTRLLRLASLSDHLPLANAAASACWHMCSLDAGRAALQRQPGTTAALIDALRHPSEAGQGPNPTTPAAMRLDAQWWVVVALGRLAREPDSPVATALEQLAPDAAAAVVNSFRQQILRPGWAGGYETAEKTMHAACDILQRLVRGAAQRGSVAGVSTVPKIVTACAAILSMMPRVDTRPAGGSARQMTLEAAAVSVLDAASEIFEAAAAAVQVNPPAAAAGGSGAAGGSAAVQPSPPEPALLWDAEMLQLLAVSMDNFDRWLRNQQSGGFLGAARARKRARQGARKLKEAMAAQQGAAVRAAGGPSAPTLVPPVVAGGTAAGGRDDAGPSGSPDQGEASAVVSTDSGAADRGGGDVEAAAGPPAAAGDRCGACGATAGPSGGRLRLCTGCRGMKYCNEKCARAAWPGHRSACKAAAASAAAVAAASGTKVAGGGVAM